MKIKQEQQSGKIEIKKEHAHDGVEDLVSGSEIEAEEDWVQYCDRLAQQGDQEAMSSEEWRQAEVEVQEEELTKMAKQEDNDNDKSAAQKLAAKRRRLMLRLQSVEEQQQHTLAPEA